MIKPVVVPQHELEKAAEKVMNEMAAISDQFRGNTYVQFMKTVEALQKCYASGFEMGFRQSELENIVK